MTFLQTPIKHSPRKQYNMLNTDANIKKLTNIFKENNFLFFYYYASLSKEMEFKIKTTLAEIKFRQLRLKKNFTKKLFEKKIPAFANLMHNNMVLLYSINALNSQNLTEINECLKIININYKNFFLVGCLINKQFYRPTEYSKYFLSENSNNEKFALTKQFFLQQKKLKINLIFQKNKN